MTTKALNKGVSENIIIFRKLKLLSQPDLAKKAGLPKSTVWKIENCKDNPTVATLNKIAVALKVHIKLLFA